MARQNTRTVIQAVSLEHTTLNDLLDDGAEFGKFYADASDPVLPTRQYTQDQMVGDGRAYDRHSQPLNNDPINYPYAGLLNSTQGVRLIRDWLGGTIDETDNTTPGTIDSLIHQLAPGEVPLLSNYLRELGGESLVHADVFVQTIEISQQGNAQPRISAGLSNSGLSKKISDTSIDTADVEDAASYLTYNYAKTRLTFSDGVNSYNFANDSRLLNVTFSGNQGVQVEFLPGDSFLNATSQCQGTYSKNVYIDVQSANIQATVYMDENFTEFDSWVANRKLTSISLFFATCEHVGTGGTHYAEIEIKIPIGEFNMTGGRQGNFSTYSFNIKAIEGDPTTGDLVQARIRQVGSIDAGV